RFEQVRQQRQAAEGDAFDPRAFESVENKRAVLDRLVDERMLRMVSDRADVAIGDAQVREVIRSVEALQVGGRFDLQQYQLVLASQVPATTPRAFEAQVREGMAQTLVVDAIADSSFATDTQVEALVRLLDETRDVAWVVVPAEAGEPAPVDDAEVQAWYASHRDDFRTPERVAIEYIVLDATALEVAPADEAALRARYEEAGERFADGEERLASHILVQQDGDTDAAQARAE